MGYVTQSGFFFSAPLGSEKIKKIRFIFGIDDFDEPTLEVVAYSVWITARAMSSGSRAHQAFEEKAANLLKTINVTRKKNAERARIPREILDIPSPGARVAAGCPERDV
jgi:hypothetical protein